MLTDDPALLRRQFLYSFITTGDQKDLNLEESYAFNGGDNFAIGGTPEDYHELVCHSRKDCKGQGFENRPFNRQGAMLEAENDMNFSPMLYYQSE